MKAWKKGFLGGAIVGGLGALPLAWWLSDMKAAFHCPKCDATLAIHKKRNQLAPHVSLEEPPLDDIDDDDEVGEEVEIVAAPTG